MDIKLSHCFVSVDDQEKALTFYRDVLGLQVLSDATFETMRWLTVGAPGQPGVEIGLFNPADAPYLSPADRQALAELTAKGSMYSVIFSTSDCDATFEHVLASGAEVMQEPVDQPYGVRDCAFRDPAGNMIRFSQYL